MSEATTGSLDAIDREILAILQTDGRLSGADIGRKVNLSNLPCRRGSSGSNDPA